MFLRPISHFCVLLLVPHLCPIFLNPFIVGATKCDDACTEISALPVVYANATSAQKICQGRKLAYHKDAKVVSLDSKPCVLNHFKAIGVESDTMFWTSDPGSVTVPPQLLSSTANPGDQSRPYVVVCEFQKYDCSK